MGDTVGDSSAVATLASTKSANLPRSVGGYELVAPIGRGGMGIVYLARRRTDGETVAVKTVHTEGEVSLGAIRREVHALSRLRHPYVVRILEQGIAEGVPWYAMDYVRGPTLGSRCGFTDETATFDSERGGHARHVAPAPRRPLAFSEVLGIGAALCEAIAYVHGEGVVHRDLKPSNVVLPSDREVVLVDFGLTTATTAEAGREVLEGGTLALGTPAYVAPEQIRGDLVDARADLYSLGCMLYEMATGRTPFVGDVAQLLHAHEHDLPLAPSTRRPVPKAFDDLVMSLLAKNVDRRLGHATDVLNELVRLGAPVVPLSGPRPRPYLYRSPFLGRIQLCETLAATLLHLQRQTPLILVAGESGCGKTRLAHEITRRVRSHGVRVVTAQCIPIDDAGKTAASALHPFRDVLTTVADRCRAGGAAETERLLGARCRLLSPYEPRLAWVPGYASAPEGEPLAPEAERHRLLEAIDSTLEALAAGARLVMVFEDLHWADELTRLYVRGAAQGLYARSGNVRLLGTYRADHADAELRGLAALAGESHVVVHRMGEREIHSLVAGMLALQDCPSELSFIAGDSGGNPFFAGELLRYLLAQRRLDRTADGAWQLVASPEVTELPRAMDAIIRSRAERLSPHARQLANLAAVAGSGCDAALLDQASDLPESERLDAQEELLARQILEVREGYELHFIHDKIRDAIYGTLDPGERRRLHHACATSLERGDRTVPLTQRLLAHHFGEGGDSERALTYLEAVADRALSTGTYEEARAAAGNALAHLPALPSRSESGRLRLAAWERRLAQATLALGQLDACEVHACRGLVAATGAPPRSRFGWAALLGRQAVLQAIHLALPARWIVRREPDPALVDGARVAGLLGRLAFYANDPLRMLACSFLSINLAERAGVDVERPRNYAGLGFTLHLMRFTTLADHYFRKARASGGSHDDLAGTAFALTTEALSRVGAADWSRASETLDRARDICARSGDPQDAEIVGVLTSHTLYYRGSLSEATAVLGQVEASVRRRGNPQIEAWALFLLGRVDLASGRLEQAESRIVAALGRLASQPDAMTEVASWGLLAETRALAGDEAGAATASERVESLLERRGPTVFLIGHGYIGMAAYQLLLARRAGSREIARRAARRARAIGGRLARLAWMFPVLMPDAARIVGEARLLMGDERVGRRTLAEGVERARRLDMRLHRALGTLALARATPASPDRHALVVEARQLLEQLGCERRVALERTSCG
jgi:hypothetical protein